MFINKYEPAIIAITNIIENIITKLNFDLHTFVMDWEEFKDLQLAYLKASVILIPGFMSWISSIEEWGPYLASWGYVAMFVNCNWIWGSTDDRANALLDGLITIQEENERMASPLFNNLDLNNISGISATAGPGA